ncbi:MAG TPA: response regulator transcription factor [Baekduia sp.]|nr:response regulator transcription factor [Baekduia sp.]
MIKVVLVDDHELLRSGIRLALEEEDDLEVVGEAADGAAGVELVLRTHPDVVLMDIRMPRVDGLEATRRLVAAGSRTRILVLTTFDTDDFVVHALRAGASGFLLKDAPPQRLAEGIRIVAAGETLLAGPITRRLIEEHLARTGVREDLRERLAELTERELEIVRRLATGRSNAELAAELGVSETTVKAHLTRALGKLGVRTRVQAVVLAYESGLVQPGNATLPPSRPA